MHSDALKRKLRSLQLHSNNFSLKQFSKTFITTALEYKTDVNFKRIICMHAMHFLIMSPCLHDFPLTSTVYIAIHNGSRFTVV